MPNPTGGSLLLLPLLLFITLSAPQTVDINHATTKTRALRQTAIQYNDNSLLVEHPDPADNGGTSSSSSSGTGYYRSTVSSSDFGGPSERNGTDNRKPAFRNCASLVASVREEEPAGVFVTRVQATDPDEADRIEYSFVNAMSERPKFRIDAHTGNIYTVYQFDRDEPAREKEVSWLGKNWEDASDGWPVHCV